MSYFSQFSQNVVTSTLNSSTTNLSAGAAFTGTAESTLGVNAIQVNLKTDQNCQIYVEQSTDNAPTEGAPHWDISDVFDYYYSEGGVGFTVQATASYYRVRVVNQSATTATTYFRLQTNLCPIVEAIPRSLDENGNLKVAVRGISDEYGFSVECTPMEQLRVAQTVRLVGSSFNGTTLDTNFWTATLANGGTAEQGNAQVRLRTNTTSAGSAILQTVRTARYLGGVGIYARMVVQNDAPTSTNTRRWGAFTTTDGAFFELSGTTFRIVTRKTSNDTVVASGSFNGRIGSTYVVDTNVHTYEIYWTNSKVWFSLDGELLHTVTASTTTWADSMNQPLRMENTNGVITTDLSMYIRVATIQRLGLEETAPLWRNIHGVLGATVLKYGPGRLKRVIVNGSANGSTCSLYDALTATNPIALISLASSTPVGTFEYGLDFYTGLTVVTANASTDVTIVYE